ncbi:translation initiation factor IF-2 [Xylaria bambusicola]|uniref:translation initiation factor IF-2 n=1 Tax=Xylaria bambusicola TaxID=326684 RepID=UPI0020086579|nr:translation initiation factor IF-2 [Xylaria bambusicola]KAI0508727.1 translation initiation factor IF-2 [Xylaria bambusicola]
MLRGRLGKRDTSICAFCQHRIYLLRQPASPQHHPFSVTRRCGLSLTSPLPLRTATNSTPYRSFSSSPTANNNELATPAPAATGRPKFIFRRAKAPQEDDLAPHEAAAREKLLLEKQPTALRDNTPRRGLPERRPVPPGQDPRLIHQFEKRAAIERHLKAQTSKSYGDTSMLGRKTPTLPAISLSRTNPGSNYSIRYELGSKSIADRTSLESNSFFRRVGHRPDPPLRKIPARDVPLNPPPAMEPPPKVDLSGLLGSEVFLQRSNNAAGNSAMESLPSQTGGVKQANTRLDKSTVGSAPQNVNSAIAPSGGFDALEIAAAIDAETKYADKSEWKQLARKPARQVNLDNDIMSFTGDAIAESQPERSNPHGSNKTLSDSRAIRKDDNTTDNWGSKGFDDSIPQAPPHHGGHETEKNRRWDLFEREQKTNKRRDGKRAQRASRFEDDEDGADAYDEYQDRLRQKELRKAEREAKRTEPIPIILPELISITAFANALKIRPDDFLVQLGELGFEGVNLDSLMAGETAALVAQEYGYEPIVDTGDSQDLKPRPLPTDLSLLPPRPPVVTIMGHVDHGKTTILDYLRKSSVAAQEHGGITQHIGAFSVKLSSGKPITFLDTPGHAAFLTMRQRGANVTDIVVLVVAADDSVKPQTLEALKHARAAKVPIIVAINKIDKDGARVDAVKHDLANAGVEIEDFGGDVQVVCVSGKTGQGMDDLEENILTLSEILDHRAELDGAAEGWVLESSLKPTGKVATVLVKRGTLRPGDYIAAGLSWAKIRHLRNEAGIEISEAPPGTPVEILGWRDLPAAGDQVLQSPDEEKAKAAVSYREGIRDREKDAAEYEAITEARKALQDKRANDKTTTEHGTGVQEVLPDEEDGAKMVNFVVKGDVHGSVEAVCAVIQGLGNHEVRPRVLRSATGPITEFDVDHAATSKSVLVNFSTTTPGHVQRMAEEQGVRILDHTVIYHLVDDVKANMNEYLSPEISTRVLGEAEVLQIFPINLRGRVYKNIAGCRVRNGAVGKNNLYRVMRNGEVVFDGKLETLKNVKKDVMEMRKGTECGMGFEEFQDLKVGDQIQAYEEVRTARSL